jgi:hypothetical protein
MTVPDSYGRGTIAFSMGLSFAYYAVQGQVLRLVGLNAPNFMTAGSMFGQGAAGASAAFTTAALTGNYVLFETGGTVAGALALAGQFSADGSGNLTAGVADVNDGGTIGLGSIAGQAVYTIAGNGTGTLQLPAGVDAAGYVSSLRIFAVDPSINLLDPNNANGGGGALVMDYDTSAVASGLIVPQSSGAFEGDYAVNFQYLGASGENDWVGQSVAASGGLTGTVDINDAGTTSASVNLTGVFTADAAHPGRWTGSFTAGGATYSISYYQVSVTLFVIVDIDAADIGIGILDKME